MGFIAFGEKYGEKAIGRLQKAGKAILIFMVEKYPGDELFDEEPPSIDLYIIPRQKFPKDKEPPKDLPNDYFKGTISPGVLSSLQTRD